MRSQDIVKALQKRHGINGREWAFFAELRAGTGYKYNKRGYNPEQRFDAWAINLYPSKKFLTIAYEIKVSRSDFLHEIAHPNKRQQALDRSNQFYFVVPTGLITPNEIPPEAGLIYVNTQLDSQVIVKAPLREIKEPNWSFLASIARRAVYLEKDLEDMRRLMQRN